MGSHEFVEWLAFLELKWKEREKEEYYLAQIAAEIRRGNVRDPRKVDVENFLLKFKAGPKKKDPPSLVESKAFWLTALGIGTEKN